VARVAAHAKGCCHFFDTNGVQPKYSIFRRQSAIKASSPRALLSTKPRPFFPALKAMDELTVDENAD